MSERTPSQRTHLRPWAAVLVSALLAGRDAAAAPGAAAAPAVDAHAHAVDYVARLQERFPQTEHWFKQAAGIRIDVTPEGLVPDWSTVRHPRVLHQDSAGQRLMPRLPTRADGATTIVLDGEPDFWVRTTPLDATPAAAEIADGIIIYPGAYGPSDLIYKLTPTHVDEYVLVPDADAPHDFRYRLELGPAVGKLEVTPELIEVLDRSGAARFRLENPFARDAARHRREGTLALDGDVLTLHVDLTGLVFPVLVDPDWTTTGRLIQERFESTIVVLPDGDVLAAGGCYLGACPQGLGLPVCSMVLDRAERWDPATGTWRQAAAMTQRRFAYAAAALPGGDVLVAGGCTEPGCTGATGAAEIYAPADDAWLPASLLGAPRAFATATTLPGGDVLVVGGCDLGGCLAGAEIFDHAARTWRAAAPLTGARGLHQAVALADGRVLVAGGCSSLACTEVLATVEIYDPVADAWYPGDPMSTPRAGHTATRLAEGDVLVVGGCDAAPCQPTLKSVEHWAPATGHWTIAMAMGEPRHDHTAALLGDGTVLIVGGCVDQGCTRTSELFDPGPGSWTAGASLDIERGYFSGAMLDDGRLLVAGGCNAATCIPWAETYPRTMSPWPDGGGPGDADGGSPGYTPTPYVDQSCTCRAGARGGAAPGGLASLATLLWLLARRGKCHCTTGRR